MGALIFVIVLAAVVVTLVIGVQKNKKKQAGKEPEVYKAAVPIDLAVVEEKGSNEKVATAAEQEALAEAKKELKVKKMAAKPKKSAEPVKRTRAKK